MDTLQLSHTITDSKKELFVHQPCVADVQLPLGNTAEPLQCWTLWMNHQHRHATLHLSTHRHTIHWNSLQQSEVQQVRQLSGLAYMPTCRSPSPQIVYNTGRHRAVAACFSQVRDGRASLSHRANERRTCYRFFEFLTLGAYPWAKCHQKGRWPAIHLDLPSYKISAQSRKRSTRYALPNYFPLFGLGGANPWAKVHQKGRWPGGLRDLPSCKISSL